MKNSIRLGLIVLLAGTSAMAATPPDPYGAVPSERQLRWHALGQYAFVHFTVNTFTDKEWGYGDEDPKLFNPTAFDANQIVGAAKAGGLVGLILVAKHHDGLCLWPTKSTPHNISTTSYKNGKGDIVREMADACKKAGIKFGVYVSPWDRNHPEYGNPGYVTAYHQQINELSSNYGPLFEMWFDGANGGSGYYGGKGGSRSIDGATYYGWKEIHAIIRRNQPDCAIWCGIYKENDRLHYAECRWGGSEQGDVGNPCWNTMDSTITNLSKEYGQGVRNGDVWCGAEGDVSIRPGWFWHENQNASVKSPQKLMDIYLSSVGRGANLILNLPPDRRGLIHENDVASITEYGEHLRKTFATNLAKGAKLTASNTRGDARAYSPAHLLDGDIWSAWITDDAVHTPEVVLDLKGEKTFNLIRLREDIRLGQRIEGVAVDAWVNDAWKEIATAPCVGAIRLCRVPKTTTTKVRIRVTKSPVCPALSDFGLFLEPRPEASSCYTSGYEADKAFDGDLGTRWVCAEKTGWIQVDLGKPKAIVRAVIQEAYSPPRVKKYALEAEQPDGKWKTVAEGDTLGADKVIRFAAPVSAQKFRLNILDASDAPAFLEIQFFTN